MPSQKSRDPAHPTAVPSEYVVDTRVGIEQVLQAIIRAGSAAYVTSRSITTRTSIRLLEIDGYGRLLFVPLSALPLGLPLEQAENVLFTTDHDGVPIEFTCQHPARVRAGDRDGYAVRLPEYIIRLQRRNAYRLPAPAIECRLEPEESHADPFTPNVLDVSGGGLDLEMPADGPTLGENASYTCSLFLPALGHVWARLKVVSIFKTATGLRYGCQFVNLSAPAELLLQRYILEEQRTRRRMRDAAARKPDS